MRRPTLAPSLSDERETAYLIPNRRRRFEVIGRSQMSGAIPSRRTLLAASALALLASATPAVARKKKSKGSNLVDAAPEAPKGNQIPYPRLVDVGHGEIFDLTAEAATHSFIPGKPVEVLGYGGTYMGPAVRLKRGTTAKLRLVNKLDRPTNLHWHGLMVEGEFDGGTQPGIAPGTGWEARLRVDQPAATLWYHAHVHGETTRDVHDGLCGMLLVDDAKATPPGLPATWGVDDLPLVLQDREFDATGRPVLPPLAKHVEHGFRGSTMIVNGTVDALAKVPSRLVRLRLLNASGARTFRLFFEDQRSFHLIGTDGGLLSEPVELSVLPLAPAERAEILVDFAEGAANLMTGPDDHEHRMGAQVMSMPDVLGAPARLVAFSTSSERGSATSLPKTLAALPPLPRATGDLKRRRFELRVLPGAVAGDMGGQGSMTHADATMPMEHGNHSDPHDLPPRFVINGKSFEMGRIDEQVKLGTTEVWEIVSPEMAHPFHLHGAQFRVLSEDGEPPKLWNRGTKDTVLVENSAELGDVPVDVEKGRAALLALSR